MHLKNLKKKRLKKTNKRYLINSLVYGIIRPFLRLFALLFVNPVYINKNNVPKEGGYILVSNHLSNYDCILIGCITIRPVHFLAKKELLDKKILGTILRLMGIVRVDRGAQNQDAIVSAIDALNNDKIVCVFPEGTTNKKRETLILPFKFGAVSFAYKSGKPIIPCAILKKAKIFSYRNKIIVGEPFYVKDDNLEKANKELEQIIINLLKKGNKNER